MVQNFKKQDKEAIIAYMTGKESVEVKDIMVHAGANELRVYPLIAELHTEGRLVILETEDLGSPKRVRLV